MKELRWISYIWPHKFISSKIVILFPFSISDVIMFNVMLSISFILGQCFSIEITCADTHFVFDKRHLREWDRLFRKKRRNNWNNEWFQIFSWPVIHFVFILFCRKTAVLSDTFFPSMKSHFSFNKPKIDTNCIVAAKPWPEKDYPEFHSDQTINVGRWLWDWRRARRL